MSASFSITAEPDRDLVRIRMSGFFTPADIAAFLDARARAHAQLTCGSNQHLTLNDVRGLSIQPQDSVAAFQTMLADSNYRSRRLAFVVAPTLARGQLARALSGRANTRMFEDPHEAEAWLLDPDEKAEPSSRRAIG
ncbi:hypothetical protein [Sphingosinicella sp.]|uniref:hypothetical protein n=1 Tax=Sphingosinicella sp. TaxID=1917971 RepID=UPI00403773AB